MTANGKFDHWSEYDSRVVNFVKAKFGSKPQKQLDGADLSVGKTSIEVKACREWNVTNFANGARRRGRFRLAGYEKCDYFLFVLARDNGEIDMKAVPARRVRRQFNSACSITWDRLFK